MTEIFFTRALAAMIDHNDLVRLIEERLSELGFSAREASIRAVQNPELIRSIRNQHSPSLKNIQKLLKVLDIDLELNTSGYKSRQHSIPLMGLIGAGSRTAYFNDQITNSGSVALPNGQDTELAAVEIRGNSMEPVYQQGDVLIFCPEDPNRFNIALHIGRDCIITLSEDSSALLKTIECGSRADVWNLHSHNPNEETMTDQKLVMALPILWIKRHH